MSDELVQALAESWVAEVVRLTDAIRWLCTEMPVGWQEMARAEGRSDVVDTVRLAIGEASKAS